MAKHVLETDSDEMFWSFLNGDEEKLKETQSQDQVLANKEEKKQHQLNGEKQASSASNRKNEEYKRFGSTGRNELQDALSRLDELEKLGVDESDGDEYDVERLLEDEEVEEKYSWDDILSRQKEDNRGHEAREQKEASTGDKPAYQELNPDTWLVEIFGDKLPMVTHAFGLVAAGVGLSTLGLAAKVLYDTFRYVGNRI